MTSAGSTRVRGSETESSSGDVYRDAGDLLIGAEVGDYRVVSVLGSGGMGTVYAARHPLIGKEVAVKVVHGHLSAIPNAKTRFIQEARALTQINHRNVVEVYSFGELADGRSYLVMERIRGSSLGHFIEQESLELSEVLAIIEQTACALAACHAGGVIHRDIKPDNVFVFGRGAELTVKLIDFGIAKVEGVGMRHGLTGDGVVVGTPAYMAPEQVRGGHVDERCDLYALGVLAYEALTGQPPFFEESVVETLTSILRDSAVPLSVRIDCPPALEALVEALMAKDRDERPTTSEVRVRVASIRDNLAAPPMAVGSSELAAVPTFELTDSFKATAPPPRGLWRAAPAALVAFGFATALLALRGFAGGYAIEAASAGPDHSQSAILEPSGEPATEQTDFAPPDDVAAIIVAPLPAALGATEPVSSEPKRRSARRSKPSPEEVAPTLESPNRATSAESASLRKRSRLDPDALLDPFAGSRK